MQINGMDRLSLENLAPNRLQEAQSQLGAASATATSSENTRSASNADSVDTSLGMNLEGLESVHMLDADRVASLIADPFGEE